MINQLRKSKVVFLNLHQVMLQLKIKLLLSSQIYSTLMLNQHLNQIHLTVFLEEVLLLQLLQMMALVISTQILAKQQSIWEAIKLPIWVNKQ